MTEKNNELIGEIMTHNKNKIVDTNHKQLFGACKYIVRKTTDIFVFLIFFVDYSPSLFSFLPYGTHYLLKELIGRK